MPANWTRLDPGTGDLASCEAARIWAEHQVADLSDAQSAVNVILRDLDATWTGESADAFRGRVDRLRRDLEDSEEAVDAARKAIIEYSDAVTAIATSAEPLKADLAATELVLDRVNGGALFDNDAEGLEHRFQAQQQAMKDAKAAVEGLAKLAIERRVADQALATVLVRLGSEAWGHEDRQAARVGPFLRDQANGRVADLFFGFATGESPRALVLGSDDPFVAVLMRSEHVNAVRQQVGEDLRSGDLAPGADGKSYNRDISNNGFVLLNDALNLSSSAISGAVDTDFLRARNLPESFLGSYGLDVFASEPAADGGVEVTYVINNDTTSDSFTRIPGTGGAHLPVAYPAMLAAEADSGDWASQHQTIVWTERVYL